MCTCRPILALAALLALTAPVDAQTRRPKTNAKLDHSLRLLAAGAIHARSIGDQRTLRAEKIAVTVHTADGSLQIAGILTTLGGDVINSTEDTIEVYMPIAALDALERINNVLSVRAIHPPIERVTSQGATVHNSAQWNAAGFSGAGIKVGIIDSAFGNYAALLGTELPAPAGVRCYLAVGLFTANLSECGSGTHGTAVAEAVIDVAPAVDLYIANPISALDFRSTIEWMADNGVRVINYSQNDLWEGPGDGTSPYADSSLASVDLAVSRGITFVMAAGNEQRATWTGPFRDANGDSFIEFSGDDDLNSVALLAGERLILQVRWEDSWTNAVRDLDVGLYDNSLNLVALSNDAQNGVRGEEPYELIVFTAPATGWYHVDVNRYSGTVPAWVQVQAFTSQPLWYWRAGWSIGTPGDSRNPGLLAVGAAPWNSTDTIAWYSSLGPTIDGRSKPDITAVAGADSATTGPGGFHGTSQASPHVAGLAALALEANPSFFPSFVTDYLKDRALPRGDSNTWGAGLAYLPDMCGTSVSPTTIYLPPGAYSWFLTVDVNGPCTWTASTTAPWITVFGGGPRTGTGTLGILASDNPAGTSREAIVNVAGHAVSVYQVGTALHPSTHDQNGDGRFDLFWQHETEGWIAAWHMDGTRLLEAHLTAPNRVSNTDWKIVGSGDFNGDGKPDLFWQHKTTGLMTLWYMYDTTFTGPGLLSNNTVSDANWEIRAIADLNGDLNPDLIWQHRTLGYLATWLMDGVQLIEAKLLTPNSVSDLQWKIVGSGDFNEDGQADLFWRHERSGLMTVWYMNGTEFSAVGLVSNNVVSDLNWQIRAIGDMNDDGKPDLVWQHSTEGWLNVWFMDGVNLVEGAGLTPRQVSDPHWRIAGPR